MPQNELRDRIKKLENEVALLRHVIERQQALPNGDWWRSAAGECKADPDFEEVVRLGRQYRKSLDQKLRTKKKAKASR